MKDNSITFENGRLRVTLTRDFEIAAMTLKEAFDGVFSLKEAAEMMLIFDGVTNSLSFLLVGSYA